MAQRFIPFFVVDHATRGELRGPYSKFVNTDMGSNVQRAALQLAVFLVRQRDQHKHPNTSTIALCDAIDRTVAGTEKEAYWRTLRAAQ